MPNVHRRSDDRAGQVNAINTKSEALALHELFSEELDAVSGGDKSNGGDKVGRVCRGASKCRSYRLRRLSSRDDGTNGSHRLSTTSPSSFTNWPTGFSSKSTTASEGRQSRVPFDVTLSVAADQGYPLVLADPTGPIAYEFARIGSAVRKWLQR